MQWDLSSMELDKLLTEETVLFIAKVSAGRLSQETTYIRIRIGSRMYPAGTIKGSGTMPLPAGLSAIDMLDWKWLVCGEQKR